MTREIFPMKRVSFCLRSIIACKVEIKIMSLQWLVLAILKCHRLAQFYCFGFFFGWKSFSILSSSHDFTTAELLVLAHPPSECWMSTQGALVKVRCKHSILMIQLQQPALGHPVCDTVPIIKFDRKILWRFQSKIYKEKCD